MQEIPAYEQLGIRGNGVLGVEPIDGCSGVSEAEEGSSGLLVSGGYGASLLIRVTCFPPCDRSEVESRPYMLVV